jgi:uncharacterized protein DUF6768
MNETSSNPTTFNPDKAARLRSQAIDAFQARGRSLARTMFAWLLVCLIFAVIEIWLFFKTTDVHSWILFAVLFLVMFESSVLIKLWYWVVNSKLGILREVKLLRMDLAAQRGSMDALEELARGELPSARMPDLSLRERMIWKTATILVATAMAVIIATSFGNAPYILTALSTSELRGRIALNADGTANGRMEWEMQNRSFSPLAEFPLSNGGSVSEITIIPAADSPYTDGFGRKLAVRREPAGVNHQDVIHFAEPVSPFARFTLVCPWPGPVATHEGDVWTVKESLGPSTPRVRYDHTLVLPSGAEVVSAEPAPKERRVQDGLTVLHFVAEPKAGQQWSYVVKYRLAGSSSR